MKTLLALFGILTSASISNGQTSPVNLRPIDAMKSRMFSLSGKFTETPPQDWRSGQKLPSEKITVTAAFQAKNSSTEPATVQLFTFGTDRTGRVYISSFKEAELFPGQEWEESLQSESIQRFTHTGVSGRLEKIDFDDMDFGARIIQGDVIVSVFAQDPAFLAILQKPSGRFVSAWKRYLDGKNRSRRIAEEKMEHAELGDSNLSFSEFSSALYVLADVETARTSKLYWGDGFSWRGSPANMPMRVDKGWLENIEQLRTVALVRMEASKSMSETSWLKTFIQFCDEMLGGDRSKTRPSLTFPSEPPP